MSISVGCKVSAEHYRDLQTNQAKLSSAARKKNFELEFGDWITAENARFEANGINEVL